MRLIVIFIFLTGQSLANTLYPNDDFGDLSPDILIETPLHLDENKTPVEDELYNEQINETQFDLSDFDTREWRKKRVQKILNRGRAFQDYDKKDALTIGQVSAIRGDAFIYRGIGRIALKKNGHFKQGDLIETEENGHVWISLIDGTMIRLSPSSTYSIESFEVSPVNLLFFHRINNGNVSFISRQDKSLSPLSVLETDRIFYPFFDIYELSDFLKFSNKDKYDARIIQSEKYRYLNFLKNNNKHIFNKKKVQHVVSTPFLTIDLLKVHIEFVVDWKGRDFIKINQSNEEITYYKKNIDRLEKVSFDNLNTWYEVSSRKIKVVSDSNLAWFGDFVTSDIPSLKVITENFITKNSAVFFTSSPMETPLRKYMISNQNLLDRKKYLISYLNKQGASFLGERAVFVRKNNYKNKFKLSNYLGMYYKYSNHFNRLFSELKIDLKLTKRDSPLKKMLKMNSEMDQYFNIFEGNQ
jgi:hypothetical protein